MWNFILIFLGSVHVDKCQKAFVPSHHNLQKKQSGFSLSSLAITQIFKWIEMCVLGCSIYVSVLANVAVTRVCFCVLVWVHVCMCAIVWPCLSCSFCWNFDISLSFFSFFISFFILSLSSSLFMSFSIYLSLSQGRRQLVGIGAAGRLSN